MDACDVDAVLYAQSKTNCINQNVMAIGYVSKALLFRASGNESDVAAPS
eukprot:CAMPEP_0178861946 /NCGR_PEP_ID=MMETSP0747-20121128/2554_1 /TAXON_ID=913974 /ORGANISM="Nitzschia punctata, Strain CCMP561" /LENGTH=48 /DNA_ID= /DNA_START= /DNA_END= /DNA_ORIENTATION=